MWMVVGGCEELSMSWTEYAVTVSSLEKDAVEFCEKDTIAAPWSPGIEVRDSVVSLRKRKTRIRLVTLMDRWCWWSFVSSNRAHDEI